MYEGNGDNPGTAQERAVRCSQACRSKKKALSGSWDGFVAKGFVVVPTSGRCYCETSSGLVCKRVSNNYDRYEWKSSAGVRVYVRVRKVARGGVVCGPAWLCCPCLPALKGRVDVRAVVYLLASPVHTHSHTHMRVLIAHAVDTGSSKPKGTAR